MKQKPQPGREGGGTSEQRVRTQIAREDDLVRDRTGILDTVLIPPPPPDVVALLSGFSNTVGTSGDPATVEGLKAALKELRAAAEARDDVILGWAACAPDDHCRCYADGLPCCGCGVPGGPDP